MSLDTVRLLINSKPVQVTSYTLRYDMFLGASDFTAEIDHDFWVQPQWAPQKFEWYINDIAMMTGFVDKVERNTTKGDVIQTIAGRDMCQILVDNYVLNPKPYKDMPVDVLVNQVIADNMKVTIVNSLVDSYTNAAEYAARNKAYKAITLTTPLQLEPVNIKWTPEALNIAKSITSIKILRTSHGHTLFDAISVITNQIGLYLYNVPGTSDILIHSLNGLMEALTGSYDRFGNPATDMAYYFQNIKAKSKNIEPGVSDAQIGRTVQHNNIIKGKFAIDTTRFYRFNRMIGQSEAEMTFTGASTEPFENVKQNLILEYVAGDYGPGPNSIDNFNKYGGLTKFGVEQIHTADVNTWYNARMKLLSTVVLQQTRKLFNFEYVVAGHSFSGAEPYFFKHKATIIDEDMFPSSQEIIDVMVYRVEFNGSKQAGTTTTLEMCLPGVFSRSLGTGYVVKRAPK